MITLKEARALLNLGLKATKKEVATAYRRAARRWHPDLAPTGAEEDYQGRMQQINAAYQLIVQFMEDYRYDLVESAGPEDPRSVVTLMNGHRRAMHAGTVARGK